MQNSVPKGEGGMVAVLGSEIKKIEDDTNCDVWIAGDDDQAIFGWAGADVDSFIKWEAREILLDKSERVPPVIQQKALEKATHVYLKAVQHFPQEVQIRVMLSLLYKEQNDFQAAKTHLKIAETQAQELVEEKGKAEDLEKLSFVYYAQGRYAEAESLLLNLLSAAPQNTDYLNQLETVRAANN